MIYFIIGAAIVTFLFHYITFPLWHELFNELEPVQRSEIIGQSLAFAVIFPIYWSLLLMLLFCGLVGFLLSLFD